MRHLFLCVCVIFVTGCSSIVDDDRQTMTVETKPDGAQCTLKNKNGEFVIPSTPGTVTIETACDALTVTCSKTGYKTKSSSMEDSHKGIVWGNVIFGGIIGYAIDRSSGAACEYPPSVMVILEKS